MREGLYKIRLPGKKEVRRRCEKEVRDMVTGQERVAYKMREGWYEIWLPGKKEQIYRRRRRCVRDATTREERADIYKKEEVRTR